MSKPTMSIAVPVHDMPNKEFFLTRLLNSLWEQSLQDFEVVITDNSDNDVLGAICEYYKGGIRYYKNSIKGMAVNTNEAIKRSNGNLIKILYLDDYLAHPRALEKIFFAFEGQWLVTGCQNGNQPHLPRYSQNIETGNNTIGSPSVLTIKNRDPMFFDETMTWLLDCDYYKRMYEKYGEPTILKDVGVIMGLHPNQATHTMGDEIKMKEFQYLKQKYA